MKSPIALLDSLFDDFERLNPGVKGLRRDLETAKRRFIHEGENFLTLALPALDSALLRGLDEGRFTCPIGFKKIRGGAIPVFLQGMLCEVFDAKTGLLKETVEYGVLRDIHMFLLFFKKAQMGPDDEEILHQKAVSEFYQCDDTASQVVIPDRHDRHLDHVCRTILLTLHKKDLEDESIYKHGPGAVQESYSANQKWVALYRELRDFVHVPQWFGHTNILFMDCESSRKARDAVHADSSGGLFCLSESSLRLDVRGAGKSVRDTEADLGLQTERGVNSRDGQSYGVFPSSLGDGATEVAAETQTTQFRPRGASAKLISVLKNSSSRRTITVEPILRQFLQQGLNTVLRKAITECRILRNCLALTDQSKNQILALEGSQNRKWATIDLKSASDLLSQKLVKIVFRHHPDFLGCLMDSRSPFVYTDGSNDASVPLGKFAGMGNATTFPVQSICFAVVGIAAILDGMGLKPNHWNVLRASRLLRVYGDDIIVHSDHAHQVVKWLHDVGLKVNVKKSFLEGNFRESCGTDAFRGVDITPLYIRYWPHQIVEGPKVCAHFVSLSNHLWLQGLYATSNLLKDLVEEQLGSALPLVSSQSGSFGWVSRQDAVHPHKWCTKSHQFLTRTFALIPVKIRDRLDGYPALLKFFNTGRTGKPGFFYDPIQGREKDHLERTTKRYQTRLVRRWVPSLTSEGLNLQV